MTEQPQPQRLRIGEGKISGYLSIFLAVISLGAVICFHFPELFTTPEFRAVYSVDALRWVLLAGLVLSFGPKGIRDHTMKLSGFPANKGDASSSL